MNKFAALVLSVVLMFGMSSCSNSDPVEPSYDKDEVFVSTVKDNTNEFDAVTTNTLVGLSATVCEAWDAGLSLREVGMIFLKNGYDPHDAGYFVGAATATYCPEHADQVKN